MKRNNQLTVFNNQFSVLTKIAFSQHFLLLFHLSYFFHEKIYNVLILNLLVFYFDYFDY